MRKHNVFIWKYKGKQCYLLSCHVDLPFGYQLFVEPHCLFLIAFLKLKLVRYANMLCTSVSVANLNVRHQKMETARSERSALSCRATELQTTRSSVCICRLHCRPRAPIHIHCVSQLQSARPFVWTCYVSLSSTCSLPRTKTTFLSVVHRSQCRKFTQICLLCL